MMQIWIVLVAVYQRHMPVRMTVWFARGVRRQMLMLVVRVTSNYLRYARRALTKSSAACVCSVALPFWARIWKRMWPSVTSAISGPVEAPDGTAAR
jgi:hypothetical protein